MFSKVSILITRSKVYPLFYSVLITKKVPVVRPLSVPTLYLGHVPREECVTGRETRRLHVHDSPTVPLSYQL